MRTIEIHLPWPPTVNSYYGHTMRGKRLIPFIRAAGKKFRAAVEEAIQEQVGYLNLDEKLHMEVILYPPDKRRRDLDNYMKALLDAMTHAKVWEDDALIDQLAIYRGQSLKGGLVTVKIDLGGPIMPAP